MKAEAQSLPVVLDQKPFEQWDITFDILIPSKPGKLDVAVLENINLDALAYKRRRDHDRVVAMPSEMEVDPMLFKQADDAE